MATISYDAQSFLIDGRRIWLVSGAMDYARIPRELWRQRLWAARQAGLNCVLTSVFWNLHEPRPGELNFQDQLDVRAFLQQAASLGLYSILRVGPYVGGGADLGGLPAWLLAQPGMALRQAHAGFMEAYARFLAALMDQIRDLQLGAVPVSPAGSIAASPSGASLGTIILMQVEHQWHCHHPAQGQNYLGELVRYLREHGCQTPILTTNNLWQRVEAAVDAWAGSAHLTADLRQLAVVQPDRPRIVCPFPVGQPTLWGVQPPQKNQQEKADRLFYRLVCTLAGGAQYCLEPFHGGTSFGFLAGRTVGPPAGFLTTSHDCGSPVGESGKLRPSYLAIKRISTFASQFAHVLAHLEPHRSHAIANLDQPDHPLTIVHQRGSQGHVIFVFPDLRDRRRELALLLPDGQTLPVYLDREEPALWLLLHANLGGVAELSWSNLRPWAFLGRRMLVLFGPAGTPGRLAINGAPLELKVPTGRSPLVLRHESLTIVVLNRQQLEAAWILPGDQLLIGALPLDPDRQPLTLPGWSQAQLIQPDGTQTVCRPAARARSAAGIGLRSWPRTPAAPRLERWQHHVPRSFVTGSDPSFQNIAGPASLESLGVSMGYGWYRLKLSRAVRGPCFWVPAGGRLHIFANGRPVALLGEGPGAQAPPLRVRLSGTLVILADNPGRFADGWRMQEPQGLAGHLHLVRPLKLPSPRISQGPIPDPFLLGQFWPGLRAGEHRRGPTLSFAFRSPLTRPLILQIHQAPATFLILANNRPAGLYDPTMSGGLLQLLIDPEHLRSAVHTLTLAILESPPPTKPPSLQRYLRLYQSLACPSTAGQWAFAPWQVPVAASEGSAGATPPDQPAWRDRPRAGLPCWHRARFSVSTTERPLFLELRGLSKGQIFLNGRNLGRYFLTTAAGQRVGPQERFYLPEPWLRIDQPNELVIFDEHGKSPHRCRLVYEKS